MNFRNKINQKTLESGENMILWILLGAAVIIFVANFKKGYRDDRPSHEVPPKNYNEGDQIITRVAGVSFEGRQQHISKLNTGDKVSLKSEDNSHDPNAIAVYTWVNEHSEKIGYIPKELAAKIAEYFWKYDPITGGARGEIIELNPSYDKPTRVKIRFEVPSKLDAEVAMYEEEMMLRMFH
jgi:hypothetical protein